MLGAFQMFAEWGSLSALIPKLGALLERMEPIEKPAPRLRHLFRDFWFFCVVMRFDIEPSSSLSLLGATCRLV